MYFDPNVYAYVRDLLLWFKIVLDSFTNTELALIVVIGTPLTWAFLFKKEVRRSVAGLVKLLASTFFGSIIGVVLIYTVAFSWTASQFDLWDSTLLKTTGIWFITAFVLVHRAAKEANDYKFFSGIIRDTAKWSTVLGFLFSYFSFSFGVELLLVFLLVVFAATGAYAGATKGQEDVRKFCDGAVKLIGWVYIFYAVYKIATNYDQIFTLQSLKEFLLPIALTIGFIPVLYVMLLWLNYRDIFLFLNHSTKEPALRRSLKLFAFTSANFRMDRVVRVRKGMTFKTPTFDEILSYARPFDFDIVVLGQTYVEVTRRLRGLKIDPYESSSENSIAKEGERQFFVRSVEMYDLTGGLLLTFDADYKLTSALLTFDNTFTTAEGFAEQEIQRAMLMSLISYYTKIFGEATKEVYENMYDWSWINDGIKIGVGADYSEDDKLKLESLRLFRGYSKFPVELQTYP